jgi:peptidoglycan biosynthesis protein MviN/MurJ (putative lipid II flippase)
LVFLLHRRLGLQNLRFVGITALKSVFAAAVMGLAIYTIHAVWFGDTRAMGLLPLAAEVAGLVFAGALFYFALTRLMGCGELGAILDMLKPVLKRLGLR